MTYKNHLLSILELFLRKKMSNKQIKKAYGNWNIKESKIERDAFIDTHLQDIHQLINMTYKYHMNEVTEFELKDTLSKLYKREE